MKGNSEFCNTRQGTWVVMKGMAVFSATSSQFERNNFPYFTFHPKSRKPIKHLPFTTPGEDNSVGLVDFDIDVISVKQMYTICPTPAEGRTTVNITLFLKTLLRKSKSQETFKLTRAFPTLQSG
jgi:hypothetical protein